MMADYAALPSQGCTRRLDPLRPLRLPEPGGTPLPTAAYLSPPIPRTVPPSQDDGAETQNGLRADPGAVPGASTLAA